MLDAAFGKKTQENVCVQSSIIRTTRLRISEVTASSHFSSIPLCCKSLWTQSRHITIALSGLHEEKQQKCGQGKWKYVEVHMWISKRGTRRTDTYLGEGCTIWIKSPKQFFRSFRKKARMVKQLHMVLFTKKTGNIVH